MASYSDQIPRAPRTLTDRERSSLLKATGQHADGFRDHVFYSFALGTALREHELCALDVGDVSPDGERVRTRFALRVFKGKDPTGQESILPDDAKYKLKKYLAWKRLRGESVALDAPLFISRLEKRLSPRTVRFMFAEWQKRAGFERRVNFHMLRHTAISIFLHRSDGKLVSVKRFARHKRITSTEIYMHPSEEEYMQAVRGQPC